MQWLRSEVLRPLTELSPAGMLAAGFVLGVGSPTIRRGLRGLAISVTKGIISIGEQFREAGEKISEDLQDLVEEARANIKSVPNETVINSFVNDTEQQVQTAIAELKEEFGRMMSEARNELNRFKEEFNSIPREQS